MTYPGVSYGWAPSVPASDPRSCFRSPCSLPASQAPNPCEWSPAGRRCARTVTRRGHHWLPEWPPGRRMCGRVEDRVHLLMRSGISRCKDRMPIAIGLAEKVINATGISIAGSPARLRAARPAMPVARPLRGDPASDADDQRKRRLHGRMQSDRSGEGSSPSWGRLWSALQSRAEAPAGAGSAVHLLSFRSTEMASRPPRRVPWEPSRATASADWASPRASAIHRGTS